MTATTLGQAMAPDSQSAFGEQDEDVDMVMLTLGEAERAREGVLPHLHSNEEIEQYFPKLVPLSADELKIGEDYIDSRECTDVEAMGESIATEILERSRTEGRRRHMGDLSPSC